MSIKNILQYIDSVESKKTLTESVDECASPMPSSSMAPQGSPVSMNISLNASGKEHVEDLISMMKHAGLDAKPEPIKSLPMRMDMEKFKGIVDKPDSPCGMSMEDYDNEPEEVYGDHNQLTKDLAGGLNKSKKMFKPSATGDNPMSVDLTAEQVERAELEETIKQRLYRELHESEKKVDELDYNSFNSDENLEMLRDAINKNVIVSVAFVKKDGSVRHMSIKKSLSSYKGSDRPKTDKQANVESNNDIKKVVDVNAYNKALKSFRQEGMDDDEAKENAAKRSWRSVNLKNVLGFMVRGKFVDLREENDILDRFGEEVHDSLTKSMKSSLMKDQQEADKAIEESSYNWDDWHNYFDNDREAGGDDPKPKMLDFDDDDDDDDFDPDDAMSYRDDDKDPDDYEGGIDFDDLMEPDDPRLDSVINQRFRKERSRRQAGQYAKRDDMY